MPDEIRFYPRGEMREQSGKCGAILSFGNRDQQADKIGRSIGRRRLLPGVTHVRKAAVLPPFGRRVPALNRKMFNSSCGFHDL